ncbi:hypothetical protein, partial [Aeromonas salmonicida]|uniref:hypothetical protein n=1 Tax=Aeromonas salmonicida TaxID=645 RepID=UPI003BA8E59B
MLRRIRVAQAQPRIHHRLPRVYPWPVCPVVVRLQPLPGQQLGVGDDKVQLQTPLVTVLHPQHAVLVFIQSGH